VDPRALAGFLTAMDEVALGTMARTLTDAGLFHVHDRPHDADDVAAALHATPTTRIIVRRWLRALVAAGRLRVDADASPDTDTPDTDVRGDIPDGPPPAPPRYRQLAATSPADLHRAWQRLEAAETQVAYSSDLLDLMRTCTGRLADLFSGAQDIRALLFPGAGADALAAAYRDNLAVRHLNRAVAAGLRRLAERHAGGDSLRILEVGGGVAGTTTEVVPALAEFGVDYLFTDPSPFFLAEAAQRFADYPQVRYGRLDLAGDPHDQGYPPNSVDVVLCPNVLHNAGDVTVALRRITDLLVPGGWLVVMENTRDDHYPLLVSLEFLEVMSGPRTDVRARHEQLFITDGQWTDLLAAAGATVVACLPEPTDVLHPTGQRVFFARLKTDRQPISVAELARHVAGRLPEYMVPTHWQVLDRLPLTGNGKVDRAALHGWLPWEHATPPAARSNDPVDALERQLADLWTELLGVEQVGRHDDFFALGGDSLLVARLVGQVRERIPDVVGLEWEVVLRHMLRQPTVAALATYLRGVTAREVAVPSETVSPLVQLHGSGLDTPDGPVTVLVHAGTGTLMPYRALITEIRRRSAGTAALIGLEIPRLADYLDADPTGQLERLAAGYVRSLVDLGPRQLHLVGYCLGGLLAVEVARGLAEAGANVATLTVVSSHSPRFRFDDEILAEYSFAVMMGIHPPDLGFPGDPQRVAAASGAVLAASPGVLPDGGLAAMGGAFTDVADCFRQLAQVPRTTRVGRMCDAVPAAAGSYEPDHMMRLFLAFRQSVFSISRYHPEPYAGDITFLRHSGAYPFPGSRDAVTAQWEEMCLGELRIVDVPGDHFSCLSIEHAPGVVRLLNEITHGAVTR
jgi:pyochelin synthetase